VKATVDHAGHYWLFGVLFGVVALAQIGVAVALWRTDVPDAVLVAAAVVTVGVIAVWLVSRSVGLPIGPWAGAAERVGVSDAIVTITELVFIAVVSRIVRPDGRVGRSLAWLTGAHAVRLGVALGSAGVLAAALGGHAH
jgi:integral membrane sensor domain MASE1